MDWRPRITHARDLGGFPAPSTTEKARGGPAEEWSFWHLLRAPRALFRRLGGSLWAWAAISLRNFWRRTNVAAAVAFWGRNDASSRPAYTSREQPRGASFDPFLHVSSAQQRPPPYVDGAAERTHGCHRARCSVRGRPGGTSRTFGAVARCVCRCVFVWRPADAASKGCWKEEGRVLSDGFSVCTTGWQPPSLVTKWW